MISSSDHCVEELHSYAETTTSSAVVDSSPRNVTESAVAPKLLPEIVTRFPPAPSPGEMSSIFGTPTHSPVSSSQYPLEQSSSEAQDSPSHDPQSSPPQSSPVSSSSSIPFAQWAGRNTTVTDEDVSEWPAQS